MKKLGTLFFIISYFYLFSFGTMVEADGQQLTDEEQSKRAADGIPLASLEGINSLDSVTDRLIKLDNYFNPVTSGQGVVSNLENRSTYDIVNITKKGTAFGNGAIWSQDEYRMDLNYDFSTSMWLYFGTDPSSGAKPEDKKVGDGMAFVMHADTAGKNAYAKSSTAGRFGGGAALGVWAQPNNTSTARGAITNSFALEFDNHINKSAMDNGSTNSRDDIMPYGHIAWNYPGLSSSYKASGGKRQLIHKDAQAVNTFGDGKWHKLSLRWDASASQLVYSFDKFAPKTITIDWAKTFGSNKVFWGFTGSTGGAKMDAKVVFEEFPRPIIANVDETLVDSQGRDVINQVLSGAELLTYQVTVDDVKGTGALKDITVSKELSEALQFVDSEEVRLEYNGESKPVSHQLQDNKLTFSSTVPITLLRGDQLVLTFKVKVKTPEKKEQLPLQQVIDVGNTLVSAQNNVGEQLTLQHHAGLFYLNSNLAPEVSRLDAQEQASSAVEYKAKVDWQEWNDQDEGKVLFTLDDLSTGQPDDLKKEAEYTTTGTNGYSGKGSSEVSFGHLPSGSYQLKVSAYDKEQKLSNILTKQITVHGTLTLVSVPDMLLFDQVDLSEIGAGEKVYHRKAGNNMLVEVSDSRQPGSSPWQLRATVSQPLTMTGKNQAFFGKMFFSENGPGSAEQNYVGEQLLLIQQTGSLHKDWPINEGILLNVEDTAVKGSYSGTINWTLQDAIP